MEQFNFNVFLCVFVMVLQYVDIVEAVKSIAFFNSDRIGRLYFGVNNDGIINGVMMTQNDRYRLCNEIYSTLFQFIVCGVNFV